MAPPWCPCPTPWESPHGEDMLAWDAAPHRRLQADEADDDLAPAGALWEMIYVGVVLVLMFSLLLSDRVGVSGLSPPAPGAGAGAAPHERTGVRVLAPGRAPGPAFSRPVAPRRLAPRPPHPSPSSLLLPRVVVGHDRPTW